MEGGHRQPKPMLRNSNDQKLLRGKMGFIVVVVNHIVDDHVCHKGWGPTKRSMHRQGLRSVQLLAALTRGRAHSDLGYGKTLLQRFRAHKRE